MPKIQIWKIMPDGELEERMIPAKRPGDFKPFKPDVREYETIERMRRVCSDINDVVKFIQCEWKLFYQRGLRLTPDSQKWGSTRVPKLIDLSVTATWFGEHSTSKIAPLGQKTNWNGSNKDEPSTYLAFAHTLEFELTEPMVLPAKYMFQDTGIFVTHSAQKVIPTYVRDKGNSHWIGVDVVLFLRDWPEIESATAVSRLTGDNQYVNRHYISK